MSEPVKKIPAFRMPVKAGTTVRKASEAVKVSHAEQKPDDFTSLVPVASTEVPETMIQPEAQPKVQPKPKPKAAGVPVDLEKAKADILAIENGLNLGSNTHAACP